MPRETVADRLELALGMLWEGTEMMRENLRRRHPEASEKELDELLDEWLRSRPCDAPGRPVPWPRRKPSKRR